MEEREILSEWVERTVFEPNLTTRDREDSSVELFFRRIPEYDDRVLRVVVSTNVAPWSIVSVYFDRRMRGVL